MRQNIY